MTREQWQIVRKTLEGALETDPSERARYLDQACGSDAELRREVESLLEANDAATGAFLTGRAVDQVSDFGGSRNVRYAEGAADRIVPGDGGDRPGRHGDRVSRGSRRRPIPQTGSDQGGARRPGRSARDPALQGRAADSGQSRSRQYRAPAGRRRHRGRAAVRGDGADCGRTDRRIR